MKEANYQATISKNKNKEGLSMIFRHPLKTGPDGKPGRRVRKGLGTQNLVEAQKFIDEMNILLQNELYWAPTMRGKAAAELNKLVVDAFYEGLMPSLRDSWKVRDLTLPLPDKSTGYSRTLLLGTTGAGKTTLVRQLIDTHPIDEHFPSTSASKTTICDIELITSSDNKFKGVVTFIPMEKVRQLTEESLVSAMVSYAEKGDDEEFKRKFMEHPEQRFRLSYLLGTSNSLVNEIDELVDESDEQVEVLENQEINENERKILLEKLNQYFLFMKDKSVELFNSIQQELEFDFETATKSDIDSYYDILESAIYSDEEFQQFVDELIDEIQSKFDLIKTGEIKREKGWPSHWTYENENRAEFIRAINFFSSNYAPNFGHLLTPLVDGIRVSGPFKCKFFKGDLKLVIMDGEGLGHTPKSFSSLSTNITKKINIANSILIVDNAAQPMQASTTAALRNLVSSGHESKISICFTHFDDVYGANIPSNKLQKDHVFNSIESALTVIGEELDKRAEKTLREALHENVFYLSNINENLTERKRFTVNEIRKLIDSINSKIVPKSIQDVHPFYDLTNLTIGLKSGLEDFHNPWRARIGLSRWMDITQEHWTRIKALTRRLGELGEDEYQELKPVADLIKALRERVYRFISRPISFDPIVTTDEMQNEAISNIAKEIDRRLHQYIINILFKNRVSEWYKAYIYRGKGSTLQRSQDIKIIFDISAPIPNEIPSIDSNKFINELKTLLKEGIEIAGGKFTN
ncbi:MAG: hypothetical protein K8I03_04535 [Ignavibacteria bacterium]|nr:hypothetical protein [Ignavibacteria bacterium]